MNISGVFIQRPVGTTLLALALALAGDLAYVQLPISALPQVDFPTIVVTTLLPGASAQTTVTTVTTPLERQLGQVPSVRQMTSVSSFGASQITLQFDLTRPIDAAEQDVQAAINAATNLLPKSLPAPPTYAKSNPADAPIMTVAVYSDQHPISQVHDFADSLVGQRLSQTTGVGLVTLSGGQKPAVRVQADPQALAAMGLTLEDVRLSVAAANVNAPKGSLEGRRQSWSLATDDQIVGAQNLARLIIAFKNGSPVRLGAVATVIDDAENTQLAGWADSKRAVLLNVQRQAGANILQVADDTRRLIDALQIQAPQGMHLEILSDRTLTTRASVHDVEWTLILTLALVIFVVYLFLQDVRATAIPAVVVPLSLLGTFCLMYLCGLGLDNLSLMALTISCGFVVDDAIVMIENIARHIEDGFTPFRAAIVGAKQMGFTIVSLTASLIAVLIPLLFMGGVLGRLFFSFSIVLTVAIVVSAILSLTLTPMMCAGLLRPKKAKKPSKIAQVFDAAFGATQRGYERSLFQVLQWPKSTLFVTFLTMGLTIYLFATIPKGFFPQQDTGSLVGTCEADSDISFARMAQQQKQLSEALRQDPEVAHIASFIGSDGINPTLNVGRMAITLVEHDKRTSNIETLTTRLQKRAAQLGQMALYLQPVQDLQIDSRQSRTQYQYTLQSSDAHGLAVWSEKMLSAMTKQPGLIDVASDHTAHGLVAQLTVDRDTAGRLGITQQMIDDVLYDAFGQRFASTTFTQINQYRIILEVPPSWACSPDDLGRLYVPTSAGTPTPLASFSKISVEQAPLSISHQGQFPAATLSFNLAPKTSLGQATEAIRQMEQDMGLPAHINASFSGTAQAFDESLDKEPALIVAALLVVYVVLGVLYESAIHPLTILSTLPSAGVGALLALRMFGFDFGIIALIGVILLIGIVKKNAIMMIDFALVAQRKDNLPAAQAIYSACQVRFRPIMMTTLAALFGAVPLALGQGIGAEMRQPLGVAIVGGLLVSQVLTLYTTPVIYLAMHRVGRMFGSLQRADADG